MDEERRKLLTASAVGAAALLANNASAQTPPTRTIRPGKPGDFDFLAGEWRIHHRSMDAPGHWIEFEGEATCWTILGGIASVEELRIPVRDFHGMGLRLLNQETKIWMDHWVNARSGVITAPGQMGGFENGVGTFISEDTDNGQPIIARGVWDRIDAGRSHRWFQGVSRDGGRTWNDTWFMEWRRA